METTHITSRKIYEQVAERIRQQITEGRLQPGQKLPSARELSEVYQVGRSTVREALSALKAMGLVEIHHGEGSFVRELDSSSLVMPQIDTLLLSKDTVLELIEARKALEVSNAGIAAQKRTEDNLREMKALLTLMEQHLGDESVGEQADMQFHLALAKATRNSIMVRLLETISGQMEAAIHETRRLEMYASKSVSEQLWREHEAVYHAVLARDSAAAQEAMQLHLFHVERVLIQFLK
ncbi:FadR/GntR family transcriptional regulator [Paenibacillus sp. y28]|uniref:FadR/GntR family transcriptional regulator n=1 Tax=Paenibacillus sp. y28 TaxID=3129110 RepID=UPI003016CDE1